MQVYSTVLVDSLLKLLVFLHLPFDYVIITNPQIALQ
jgi:hypothetical protein